MKVYFDEKLKNICLPISPKHTFKSSTYSSRCSSICISENQNFSFFIAWKRKDNKSGILDLDLDACAFKMNYSDPVLEYSVLDYCDYTRKTPDQVALKHSGDFTSCRAFDPNNPVITAEFINVDHSKFLNLPGQGNMIAFSAHSYNYVDFDEYDIFFGVIDSTYINDKCVDLSKASIYFQLECFEYNVLLALYKNNKIYFYGEPFNCYRDYHSKCSTFDEQYSIIKKYENYDIFDLHSFYQCVVSVKYPDAELTENMEEADLVITNENLNLSDANPNQKIYKVYEHQNEIEKFMNT